MILYNPVHDKWGIEGKDIWYINARNYFPPTFGIQNMKPGWTSQVVETLQAHWDATVQKLKMEDINNEYHFESAGSEEWKLFPYQVKRFEHEQKVRQPGEPLFSAFEFNNPYDDQPMIFILNLIPTENSNASCWMKKENFRNLTGTGNFLKKLK